MTDILACEALATKAELEELRQQINELFGRLEDDETQIKDVLNDGNFEETRFIGRFMPNVEIKEASVKASRNLGSGVKDNIYLKDRVNNLPRSRNSQTVKSLQKIITGNTTRSQSALKIATQNVGAIGTVASIALQALNTGITLIQILGFNQAVLDNMDTQFRTDQNDFNSTFRILKLNREDILNNREVITGKVNELTNFINQQTLQLTENNRVLNEQDLELKNRLNIIELIKNNITDLTLQLGENKLEYEDLAIEFAQYRGDNEEEINALKDYDFTISNQLIFTQDKVTALESELIDVKSRLQQTETQVAEFKEYSTQKGTTIEGVKNLLNDIDITVDSDTEIENKFEEARVRLTTIYDYSLSSSSAASGGGGFPQSARESLQTTQNKQIETTAKLAGIDLSNIPGFPIKDFEVARFDNPFSSIIDSLIPEITKSGELSDVSLENFSNTFDNKFENIGATLAALTTLINTIDLNTTPTNLGATVANAVCSTTAPGGCSTKNITNPLQQGQQGINNKLNNILSGISAGFGAGNAALNTRILDIAQATNNIVTKGWASTAIDKSLNAANFALTLHNSMMLSSNIAETVLETINIILNTIGVTDSSGNPIAVDEWLKNAIEAILKDLVGAQNYAQLTLKLTAANRIYQAGMNVLDNVTDLIDTTMELEEYTGENVSKIGNALLTSGAINFDSYEKMIDDLDDFRGRSKWLRRLETAEEVTDKVYAIADNIRDIKEIGTELKESKAELVEALNIKQEKISESTIKEEEDIKKLPEPKEEDEQEG